jgi:hypothetical protein
MKGITTARLTLAVVLIMTTSVAALGAGAPTHRTTPRAQSFTAIPASGPFVLTQQGDTTWLQPYPDTSYCPGDPNLGHGGEGTGGPDGSETWCFEGGPGDSCGVSPPWDANCFDHVDVRAMPSPWSGTNFWHIDTYRADQSPYCGSYCLWCGSDSVWTDGLPVECGTWGNTPGYGDLWNCIVELDLDSSFTTSGGCTIYFDLRYDTECKYDYFYIEFHDSTEWVTLATFNASSNNPGAECGGPGGGNPDYWGFTDAGQPYSASWVTRSDPANPAFYRVLTPDTLEVTEAPRLRWRFESDRLFSDADGGLDTDGAAFIDNVWVFGDTPADRYQEDFEVGEWDSLAARGWSLPNPEGEADLWAVFHDPDPPYEGGDGGDQSACLLDSSFAYLFKPRAGHLCGWYSRLISPSAPIQGTGCAVQFDFFEAVLGMSCAKWDVRIRFYDGTDERWCPWASMDGIEEYHEPAGWYGEYDRTETALCDPGADSVQFAWDIVHYDDGFLCCNKGTSQSRFWVDNISLGFFGYGATTFSTRPIDLLHDSFHDAIAGYNSFFDAYDTLTVTLYSQPVPPALPPEQQFNVDVIDVDGLASVDLLGSITAGTGWLSKPMVLNQPFDPGRPGLGGTYCETWDHSDFGHAYVWPRGAEIWYYVIAVDSLGNTEYLPRQADPNHPAHTGSRHDYFSFSILPLYPETYEGVRVLLVDGGEAAAYDWSPCLKDLTGVTSGRDHGVEDIYERTLTDAGYCFDKFDIAGISNPVHIHCIWFDDYDAVVWETGGEPELYLFDKEAQEAIRDYLDDGGKVVLCGDRIAYNMEIVSADSLAGEFLRGIMGCTFMDLVETPFTKPYVYLGGQDTVHVLGTPVAVGLDSLVLYRECPGLPRQASYVQANSMPPAGYTAQPLVDMLNPNPIYDPAHGAIYVEKAASGGQCVYINHDLSAFVNEETAYCDGISASPVPDFQAGVYEGRAELMRLILEDLFGLPSNGPGAGGSAGIGPDRHFRWALAQNAPNPCNGSTEIRFDVARTGHVSIRIYNVAGRLVRTLVSEPRAPGKYTAHWNGRNDSGARAASGVYFYRMDSGTFSATRKMLLLN